MSNSTRGGGNSPATESQHHFSPALIGNDLIRRDFFFVFFYGGHQVTQAPKNWWKISVLHSFKIWSFRAKFRFRVNESGVKLRMVFGNKDMKV